MYESLLRALEAPALYQRGPDFWDDAHISQQMLYAHLDDAVQGASRDAAFMDRSVAFIAQTAPPGEYPRLLDLGCGPGRYARRFAKAGYQVTGVDFSRRSIAYAQQREQQEGHGIRYLHQNYLELDAGQGYDLATLIFCDYGALATDDRARCLRNAFAALRPGGLLLLDVFSMREYERFDEKRFYERHEGGGFWCAEDHLVLCADRKYPPSVTLDQRVVVREDDVQTYYIWNTYFSRDSLMDEARQAGFALVAAYDDVAGAAFTGESPTLALLLAKP